MRSNKAIEDLNITPSTPVLGTIAQLASWKPNHASAHLVVADLFQGETGPPPRRLLGSPRASIQPPNGPGSRQEWRIYISSACGPGGPAAVDSAVVDAADPVREIPSDSIPGSVQKVL